VTVRWFRLGDLRKDFTDPIYPGVRWSLTCSADTRKHTTDDRDCPVTAYHLSATASEAHEVPGALKWKLVACPATFRLDVDGAESSALDEVDDEVGSFTGTVAAGEGANVGGACIIVIEWAGLPSFESA
jgi:hypothetical protein